MAGTLDRKLFREAKKYMPGGVNSPVRSFGAVGGSPIFIKSGKGSKIYSEDGKEFIDYCMSWGALMLGHAHPKIVKAVSSAAKNGTSFGAATKSEIELTSLITKAFPSISKIRLTNSGTEAVMGAIRLARAYTKRNKILKFEGSYHGHADYLLDCNGVPRDFTKYTLVCPYNDAEKARKLIGKHGKEIAAIIVEPVAANMGVIPPRGEFLHTLKKLAHTHGIILIFDEVITGFRLSYGGAQKLFGIEPDMTCLGKIIGGGLPMGAFGGRRDIMRLLAPEGSVYQAGTFSGNPLCVSAGLAMLKILYNSNSYAAVNKLTRHLCEGIKEKADKRNMDIRVNFAGSMFSIFFSGEEVVDYQTASIQDRYLFIKFYHQLLKGGAYLSPSGMEANFLSFAHDIKDINKTLRIIDNALPLF